MSSLLDAAHQLAQSTSTTYTAGDVPNPKPIEPPFVKTFFHKGVVVWWIFVFVGIVTAGVAVVERTSGTRNISSATLAFFGIAGAVLAVAGAILLALSY